MAAIPHVTLKDTSHAATMPSVAYAGTRPTARSRHSPTQAESGITASGIENIAPLTCQMLTSSANERNTATMAVSRLKPSRRMRSARITAPRNGVLQALREEDDRRHGDAQSQHAKRQQSANQRAAQRADRRDEGKACPTQRGQRELYHRIGIACRASPGVGRHRRDERHAAGGGECETIADRLLAGPFAV